MPTYLYKCDLCLTNVDIIKPMSESSRDEYCQRENCTNRLTRMYTSPHIIGASVTSPEYNPGLGCVVKNKAHKEDILKQRGLVEIGKDFKSPENQHKHFDKKREELREERWKDPSHFDI